MTIINDVKTIIGKGGNEGKQGSHKKVLIVEDEKALIDILGAELQDAGFDVIKAENGQEGLEKIMKEKPDIVVLDLMMPVMSGNALLHRLRDMDEFKRLPVVVLTNAGDIDNMRDTQRYSDAIEFLIKSNVNLSEIVEKVKSLSGA